MSKPQRILEISEDHAKITLPDSRYYKRNGKYYPSVTYILQLYPKGPIFEDWLKKVGYASEYIVKKASEDGTQVHNMIESYLNGTELKFLSSKGEPQYDPEIWQMFLKFVEFWETHKPTLLETEVHLFSDELKVAGTCDMICKIDDELWVIDFKTSNSLHTSYDLQTAFYGKAYEECFGALPTRYGILWLKSLKRGPKAGKIQGKGWELYESERSYEENLNLFKTIKTIFDIENPKAEPSFTEFRTTAKIQ
jgi:hypothetical protein